MKKALWILSSLALVGFSFTACDDDETDACDNKCDEDAQICAPIKGGTHSCVAISKLNDGAHECYDNSSKAIKSGYFLEADGQDYRCTQNTTTTTTTCQTDSQCTGALPVCDVKAASPVCVASIDYYKYVRIDDKTTGDSGYDPGADIDAVVLTKDGASSSVYAVNVVSLNRGDGKSKNDGKIYAADPQAVIGAPDSLINYGKSADADICYYYKKDSGCAGNPKCNSDKNNAEYCGKEGVTCTDADLAKFDYTFVSLGGGSITLEMGGAIEDKDKLDIIEVGDCKLTNTGEHKAGDGSTPASIKKNESMEVFVSVSKDASSFKSLGDVGSGQATGGVFSIKVDASKIQ